jgi:hypothetical protein
MVAVDSAGECAEFFDFLGKDKARELRGLSVFMSGRLQAICSDQKCGFSPSGVSL